MEPKKKIIKTIKIDTDKCLGCRACELACSAFHAVPRYSSINLARARLRIIRKPLENMFLPVFAGQYTAAECMSRSKYVIDGKEYDECDFCRASCSVREAFKEPDSELPLKCDVCEENPPGEEPWCVQVCRVGALIYEEREEEIEKKENLDDLELGLESLVNKYGLKKVVNIISRFAKR